MGFGWGEKKAGGETPPAVVDGASGDQEAGSQVRDADVHVECPPHTTELKLMTKIDLHVIPWLCIMYLLAFLGKSPSHFTNTSPSEITVSQLTYPPSPDRVNIANAKIFGLAEDLDLDGTLYNNALVVFFVPYIIFEVPSNILLKRFKPHVWLGINMFLFGFTTMMQGLVQNYAGLVTCRFFLGLFETGMFPGGMSVFQYPGRQHHPYHLNPPTPPYISLDI